MGVKFEVKRKITVDGKDYESLPALLRAVVDGLRASALTRAAGEEIDTPDPETPAEAEAEPEPQAVRPEPVLSMRMIFVAVAVAALLLWLARLVF